MTTGRSVIRTRTAARCGSIPAGIAFACSMGLGSVCAQPVVQQPVVQQPVVQQPAVQQALIQQDVAYVVGRQPNFVTVMQQQCQQTPVQISTGGSSVGGTIVGGVLGAALGNQIGRGDGKTVATAVGAVLGSQIGGQQAAAAPTVEYRTICNQVPVQVQQGETLTFEYRGRRFSQLFP